MGWGEPHVRNAGTTGEIEEAHKAFDELYIKPGSLAVRALEAARLITRYDKATGVTIIPSLTRSGVTCGNPECPKVGKCGGECVRNF